MSAKVAKLATAVANIMEQVRNYAAATEADFRGFRPNSNKMCVAKSSDDGQWYRAACLAQEEDTFVLFFADFGFVEEVAPANILPVDPALMKAPLLANHCIMEGFEDLEDDEAATVEATEAVKELLPINELAKVEIAKKSPEGVFVISVPEISEGLKDIDKVTTAETVAQGPSVSTPAPHPPAEKVAPAAVPPQAAPAPVPAAAPAAIQAPPPANNAAMLAIQEQMLALQKQLAAMQQQ